VFSVLNTVKSHQLREIAQRHCPDFSGRFVQPIRNGHHIEDQRIGF